MMCLFLYFFEHIFQLIIGVKPGFDGAHVKILNQAIETIQVFFLQAGRFIAIDQL